MAEVTLEGDQQVDLQATGSYIANDLLPAQLLDPMQVAENLGDGPGLCLGCFHFDDVNDAARVYREQIDAPVKAGLGLLHG